MLVAPLATRALIALAFPTATFVPVETTPSLSALLFASVLAIVTGLLFTGGPAWAMSRTPPLDALAGVGRGGHARSFVPRRSLVVVQVALSFAMIASAGLLATSLLNLERQPLGFDPDDRLVIRIDPPPPATDDPQAAGAALLAPAGAAPARAGRRQRRLRALQPDGRQQLVVATSRIAGRAAGMRRGPTARRGIAWGRGTSRRSARAVLRGRAIDDRDVPGARRVAVVNQAFAAAVLRRRRSASASISASATTSTARTSRSSGVVEDVKYTAANQPVRPMIFLPAFQSGDYADASARNVQARSMLLRAIVIRTGPGSGEHSSRRSATPSPKSIPPSTSSACCR